MYGWYEQTRPSFRVLDLAGLVDHCTRPASLIYLHDSVHINGPRPSI